MSRGAWIILLLVAGLVFAATSHWGRTTETIDEQRVKIYPSVAACRAAEENADTCDKAFADAQRSHEATAPRYDTLATCEERYGPSQCYQHSESGGSWFFPAMAGFMLGHALSGPGYAYQPVYYDRQGYAYSGGSYVGAYSGGWVYNRPPPSSGTIVNNSVWSSGSRYAVQTVQTPATRGGFGGSASSVSGPRSSGGWSIFGSSASSSSSVSRGGFGSIAAHMASSASS